ncbi:MAG: hypothetical protein AAGJ87_03405 [Pseudomonadota bacterium]
MILSTTLTIIIALCVLSLVVAASLSPIESMSWWAGWSEDDLEADETAPQQTAAQSDAQFVIYLSGISTMAGHYLADQEARFIEALRIRTPDAEIISDIFPYAPSGKPLLAAPRILDRFWRAVLAMRLKGRGAVATLANLRNFFQVLVSADQRYGPIFNLGAATVIIEALERHGYQRGSGAPVTIIGFSGGAQVGLGATPFLTSTLAAPIDIIALGGVMASGDGPRAVRKIYRLVGARDVVQRLGALFFPERWRLLDYSAWNEARRNGRIEKRRIGRMKHAGPEGYFGVHAYKEGVRYVDDTLDAVAAILRGDDSNKALDGKQR